MPTFRNCLTNPEGTLAISYIKEIQLDKQGGILGAYSFSGRE